MVEKYQHHDAYHTHTCKTALKNIYFELRKSLKADIVIVDQGPKFCTNML